MSQNGQRRKWTAAEKLRIVLAGMQPNVEVSDLCRREGINPTQYYGWKKQLLSSATKIFDAQESKRDASEENNFVSGVVHLLVSYFLLTGSLKTRGGTPSSAGYC